MSDDAEILRTSARARWADGRLNDALDFAWQAFDAAPRDRPNKFLLGELLNENWGNVVPDRATELERLLSDREIDPDCVARACWSTLQKTTGVLSGDGEPRRAAEWLEANAFPRRLLSDAIVTVYEIEEVLTRTRRWLLNSGSWRDFPQAAEA